MKLIRNAVGISTVFYILLLLVAAIVGAVLSYMWTMAYYISLGVQLPEAPTVIITGATFDAEDPTFFNLTLLNPSFSPFDVNAAQVMVSVKDGVLEDVTVEPELPQEISIGKSKILTCFWKWTNHTGETVKIHVFVTGGSGATFQAKTHLVEIAITEAVFNSSISLTHFNITVQNSASSATYITISNIMVDTAIVGNVTPILPYALFPNSSVSLMCPLNWTDYQGEEVVVRVETLQGYTGYRVQKIPEG